MNEAPRAIVAFGLTATVVVGTVYAIRWLIG
jgi:hypothetical protein